MDMMQQFREWGIDIEVINDKEYIFIPTQPYMNQCRQLVVSLDMCSVETESIVTTILIPIKELLDKSSHPAILHKYKEKLIKQFKEK